MPTTPALSDIARWTARSPAEKLAGAHFSRAKAMNGGHPNGYWSARQWLELVARCGSRCHWCGRYTDQPSPDHIVPLARGGKNSIDNLTVSCRRCQSRRRDMLPDEYLAWREGHPDPDSDPTEDTDCAAKGAV